MLISPNFPNPEFEKKEGEKWKIKRKEGEMVKKREKVKTCD